MPLQPPRLLPLLWQGMLSFASSAALDEMFGAHASARRGYAQAAALAWALHEAAAPSGSNAFQRELAADASMPAPADDDEPGAQVPDAMEAWSADLPFAGPAAAEETPAIAARQSDADVYSEMCGRQASGASGLSLVDEAHARGAQLAIVSGDVAGSKEPSDKPSSSTEFGSATPTDAVGSGVAAEGTYDSAADALPGAPASKGSGDTTDDGADAAPPAAAESGGAADSDSEAVEAAAAAAYPGIAPHLSDSPFDRQPDASSSRDASAPGQNLTSAVHELSGELVHVDAEAPGSVPSTTSGASGAHAAAPPARSDAVWGRVQAPQPERTCQEQSAAHDASSAGGLRTSSAEQQERTSPFVEPPLAAGAPGADDRSSSEQAAPTTQPALGLEVPERALRNTQLAEPLSPAACIYQEAVTREHADTVQGEALQAPRPGGVAQALAGVGTGGAPGLQRADRGADIFDEGGIAPVVVSPWALSPYQRALLKTHSDSISRRHAACQAIR